MTEVKSKTSQGSVLSGVNQKTSGTGFDIRSWQGLTAVLQAARSAQMDDTAYAAFRDMVLSYAQSGGDPALKSRIDAAIQSFSKPHEPKIKTDPVPEKQSMGTAHTTPSATPAVTKSDVPQQEVSRMRMGRPVPSFGLSASPRPVTETQVPQAPAPVATRIPTPVSAPSPVPAPTSSTVAQADVVSDSKPAPAPQVVPTKAESAPSVSSQSLDAYKARITEIKRIVHSTIGNPVTLIDAGNTIGRDYMNALLTAMKTAGAGGTGIEEAMEKLEAAFSAVQTLSPRAPEVEEKVENEIEVPVEEPPAPTPIEVPEVEEVLEQRVQEAHIEVPQEVIPQAEEAVPMIEETELKVPEAPVVQNFPSSYEPAVLPKTGTEYVEYGAQVKAPEASAAHPPHQAVPAVPMTQDEIRAAVARVQSPEAELESDEITAALMQLLHEWNIFASSGMFGTGPGGYDHPLYKTLAPLPMLTVANGGWDNAKTEERQSIRDYINAWRHEQAISYNPTESFEHYLRRVVQRVLKRQKGA